ncbi:MAG: hypothetical protein AMK75_07060 [Planctomycetes bacterium SM23_65]|nr:MAG: hypothetical protein AMK75_07060 [Planctomycetes bacterium SM23_65]
MQRRSGSVRHGVLAAVPLLLLALSSRAMANIDYDPKPTMRWSELVGCELVVVAKYEAHDLNGLRLRVVRVLKGKDVKPDDVVKVALRHRYSIETGPTGLSSRDPNAKRDGIPKLCYAVQIFNPGDPLPTKIIPDVRQDAVYFFSKADKPALERKGQVQFALFADGWRQAVNGLPMGLTFRLMQSVSGPVSWDAMEELGRTRDPVVIRKLIDWTVAAPAGRGYFMHGNRTRRGERILSIIGDLGGDVYTPLWVELMKGGRPGHDYALYSMRELLAQIDPKRAFRDYAREIAHGKPWRRDAFIRALGYIRSEEAVALSIDLLTREKRLEPVLGALYSGLKPPVPWHHTEVNRLRAFARPKLAALIQAGKIDTQHLKRLHDRLPKLVDETPQIDLTQAAKVLLDPSDPAYHGRGDGEGNRLFETMKDFADPKYVPLLARIFREVPAARGPGAYRFREALGWHATLFPNAVKAEFKKQGVFKLHDKDPNRPILDAGLLVTLGGPMTTGDLRRYAFNSAEGFKRVATPELIAWLKKDLMGDAKGRGVWDRKLAMLLEVDAPAALEVIETGLGRREKHTPYLRATLLAFAVRHGRPDLVDELIELVEQEGKHWRKIGNAPYIYKCLVTSRNERAVGLYLSMLDERHRVAYDPFDSHLGADHVHDTMLAWLSKEYPDLYLERVGRLAASKYHGERVFAVMELRRMGLDLDYNPDDLAPERKRKLARLLPVIAKAGRMTPTERRRFVLGLYGVTLEGKPGKGWYAALAKATGHYDTRVVVAAIELLGEIADDFAPRGLLSCPFHRRETLTRAWLADRGFNLDQPRPQ